LLPQLGNAVDGAVAVALDRHHARKLLA
jgi:hypothetical protein